MDLKTYRKKFYKSQAQERSNKNDDLDFRDSVQQAENRGLVQAGTIEDGEKRGLIKKSNLEKGPYGNYYDPKKESMYSNVNVIPRARTEQEQEQDVKNAELERMKKMREEREEKKKQQGIWYSGE